MSNVPSPQPLSPIRGPAEVPQEVAAPEIKEDRGASTIEASKLVATLLTLPLLSSAPILVPPSKESDSVEGMTSILASMNDRKKMSFLFSVAQQMGEIIHKMNETFAENLKEIQEETRRILESWPYRIKEEIRIKGDPKTGNVSGGLTPEAALALAPKEDHKKDLKVKAVDNVERLEQLHQKVKAQSELEIPFTVLFTVAGTLAFGKMALKNDALDDVAKLVERLQPITPQIKDEEIKPLINLMVMTPIIFRPLDEGIGNIKNAKQVDYAKLVENFAKDVIKMVSDPTFALLSIVNNIERVDNLTPDQKGKFIAILKLILTTVALSLIYSLDVGKIQEGKFFGMEPLELRALLDPDRELPLLDPKKKMTPNEELMWTLINLSRLQMAELPRESKESSLDAIMEFLSKKSHVGKLLDPSKVLLQVLQSMDYKLPMPNPLYG